MSQIEKVNHRAAWTAKTLTAQSAAWIYMLREDDIAELDSAMRSVKAKGLVVPNFNKDDFPIPGLMAHLTEFKKELEFGLGIMLLKGLPIERYSKDEASAIYWGIGAHIGKPWEQNLRGHLLGDIIDEGKTLEDTAARGYQTTQHLDFHTDGSDFVALICLKQAPEGGEFQISSAVAAFNKMTDADPESLQYLLDTPIPYDWRGEEPTGTAPFHNTLLFERIKDGLGCFSLPFYVESSQRHPDARRLTDMDRKALAALDKAVCDPELVFEFKKVPGDIAFLNNNFHLHARSSYVNSPDPKEKRHLRRLWLESPAWEGRRPQGMQNILRIAHGFWAKPNPTVPMWDNV